MSSSTRKYEYVSVSTHQLIRRIISDDVNLYEHHYESLKSRTVFTTVSSLILL